MMYFIKRFLKKLEIFYPFVEKYIIIIYIIINYIIIKHKNNVLSMKLVKIKKDNELWYFTKVRNAAQYLNVADAQIYNAIKQQTKYKGWEISQFDYDFNTTLNATVDPKISDNEL